MKRIIGLLFVLVCTWGHSAEVEWSNRLEGSDIVGGYLLVEDGDYMGANFVDISSFGYVRLGLNERVLGDYLDVSGITTISVDLLIQTYDDMGDLITPDLTTTIEMEYSNGGNEFVIDASDYRMPGVHRFEVYVTAVNGVSAASLGDYVYLQAGFYAERFYELDNQAVPDIQAQMVSYDSNGDVAIGPAVLPPSTDPSTDEIYLNWDYVEGAEYYDLEWTWVDNYSDVNLSGTLAPSAISMDEFEFKTNSTRIRTSDQSYRIPNIFGKGYLIYRVRGVGRWMDAPRKDLYGKWSTANASLSHVGNWDYVVITQDHSDNESSQQQRLAKNWQYQATYAEEGKKKEVTQYFDGSLRGRQTVTRINSDDHSVVGETIYDNEGRGVVQVLPVPQDNPAIEFYPSLNQSSVYAKPFSHWDFDWEENVATCEVEPSNALDGSSGAGHYYSNQGFDPLTDQDWQRYVPNSNGYAYTQVEYTPDNTGRIRNQSGVGVDHTIGSEHETYYYYTQPSQQELDRLFGYKVGYKSRYKKNMVVDANGQVSISYLDAQGRVIATSLAGDNVTQFESLTSESDNLFHKTIKTDLLNNGNPYVIYDPSSNNWEVDDELDDNMLRSTGTFGNLSDELVFETQIAVPQTTDYIVEYDVKTSNYDEQCELEGVPTQGVNYPYVYDLDISLLDDCADDKLEGLTTVFDDLTVGGVNSANFPLNSGTGVDPGAQLGQGSYTLMKSLRVNQEKLEEYKLDYLSENNACILTWDDFYPGVAPSDGCITSCEECAESLGTDVTEYIALVADGLGVDPSSLDVTEYTLEFQLKVEQCYEPCGAITTCDVYDQLIRMDVTPYGQYARTVSGEPGLVSIFNSGKWRGTTIVESYTNTVPPNTPDPNDPNVYIDEFGNVAMVEAYETAIPVPTGANVPSYPNPFQYQLTPNGTPAVMVYPWQLTLADFIYAFEPSWTDALMGFHPEYPYFEYAQQICSQTYTIPTSSPAQTISSEAFDNILREHLDDFASMTTNIYGINFETTATAPHPLYSQDPYFHINYSIHPQYGSFDLTVKKDALMYDAITEDYKGQDMSMIKYAIKTAIYGNDLSVTIPVETWDNFDGPANGEPEFTPEQKNAIWSSYKSYYLSYKAEINQLLMDFYGFGINYNGGGATQASGIFNGCIGEGNNFNAGILPAFSFSTGTSVYPTGHYDDFLAGWMELWSIGPLNGSTTYPHTLCDPAFDSRETRFPRIDALSNPASTTVANAVQLSQNADYVQWQQTGLCPLTIDMERLIGDLLINHGGEISTQTTISQGTVTSFVPDLYEAFTGNSIYANIPIIPNTVTMDNVEMTAAVGTVLTINFALDNVTNTPVGNLVISAPSSMTNPAITWGGYNSTWTITGVSNSYVDGNQVKLLIVVDHVGTPVEQDEYIITYTLSNTATPNFNACLGLQQQQNDPSCEKEEEFEAAMMILLQTLIDNGDLYSTVDLTLAPYDVVYGQSILAQMLGSSSPVWTGSTSLPSTISSLLGTFTVGSALPSDLVFVNGVDLNISNSTFALNWVTQDLSGVVDQGITTYSYNYSGDAGLYFACECDETLVAKNLPGFVGDLLTPVEGTHSYLTEISDYIGIANPVIGSWEQTASEVFIQVYDATDCVIDQSAISCEGASCVIRVLVDQSNVLSNNNVGLATYVDNNEFSLTINGEPVIVSIECLDITPCLDCVAEPLEPVSCSDAYDDYKDEMEDLYNAPLTDPLEQSIFIDEHLIDELTFCESSYAYITAAYLDYLSDLGITSFTHSKFISITQFGSTPIGFSNLLLSAAVDNYVASGGSLTWNEFVNEDYMEQEGILCPAPSPAPYLDLPIEETPCDQWENNIIAINAVNQYQIYLEQMGDAFEQAYIEGAMASVKESFSETHEDKEYHYTLYTYDRAGNLVATVPPKGVHRLEYDVNGSPITSNDGVQVSAAQTAIAAQRDAATSLTTDLGQETARLAPEHSFETEYRYNSLNQLVYQHTPDGGESRFAYDALGRLIMSQNAKQKQADQYSYTKYDFLGRVIEVGELTIPNILNLSHLINSEGRFMYPQYISSSSGGGFGPLVEFDVNDPSFPDNLSMTREEVTRTIYDELGGVQTPFTTPSGSASTTLVQDLFGAYASDNTRNRIVGVIYQEDYSASLNDYQSASFYDYDVHGNVKELIQVYNSQELMVLNQHIKHVEYEYDLVSGNVNQVTYQKGKQDQFMHRYCYDSDNRIKIAQTSKDGIVWEKDAKYFYYDHGPLARTELGEKKVQSCDYAYTIQGWLKTVNGEQVDHTTMMGQDGKQTTINSQNGRDAHGFSLSYFDNDYESYATSQPQPHMLNYSPNLNSPATSLYNGNIRAMMTALVDVDENMGTNAPLKTHQTTYTYDQLNRIKSMEGNYREIGQSPVASGYSSNYSFDENGNLETLQRFANNGTASVLMDDFDYKYDEDVSNGFNGGQNNRLLYVTDGAGASLFGDADIDISMATYNTLGNYNYEYDEIGQLIKDRDEGIEHIEWKVTNKVEEIEKVDGNTTTKIHFDYDPMGNRIAKHVITIVNDPSTQTATSSTVSTYYFLDAQGNCMSIYEFNSEKGNLELSERNMYGSSRLGLEQVGEAMGYDALSNVQTLDLSSITLANGSCTSPGWGFVDGSVSNYQSTDFDNDGDQDLVVSYTGAISSFSANYWFNTIIGEEYTVNFSILDYQVGYASSSPIYACSSLVINPLFNSIGDYSVTFTATTDVSRIKWYNIKNPNPSGQIVISDISIIGKGDVHGTGQVADPAYITSNQFGDKRYELSNHLGNVLEVITDRKLPIDGDLGPNGQIISGTEDDLVDFYTADVIGFNDYYPFGMIMPGRNGQAGTGDDYRYSFQGQEKDDEIKEKGSSINYKYRMHDPRIGRFFAVDPLTAKYPHYTPYSFSGNKVIHMVELEGLEEMMSPIYSEAFSAASHGATSEEMQEMMNYFIVGYAAGAAILFMPATITNFLPAAEAAVINTAIWTSNPVNQALMVEGAGFVGALFYDGPEDLSPGGGDELGKVFKRALTPAINAVEYLFKSGTADEVSTGTAK